MPANYPETVGNLIPVKLDERGLAEKGIQLIYAGAEAVGNLVRPSGSRFAALLAMRDNLELAERAVDVCLERLHLDGLRWRKDVARKALVGQRIDQARLLGLLNKLRIMRDCDEVRLPSFDQSSIMRRLSVSMTGFTFWGENIVRIRVQFACNSHGPTALDGRYELVFELKVNCYYFHEPSSTSVSN